MPAIYGQLFLFLDGQLLAENTSVTVRYERRAEDVFSFENGYEGQDVGPATLVVEATNVVPRKGAEYPFEDVMLANQKVELYLQEGSNGKGLTSSGELVDVQRNGAVGQNYTLNFTFRGEPATFQ